MANTPLNVDVPTLVADRISRFSTVVITDLDEEQTLLEDLDMGHPALVKLAEALRIIVKLFNTAGTVVVGDVEDSDATVGSTIKLVQDRITG